MWLHSIYHTALNSIYHTALKIVAARTKEHSPPHKKYRFDNETMVTLSSATTIIALTASLSLKACNPLSIRPQSSHFLGKNVDPILQGSSSNRSTRIITMRKQKASNKRTRRSQRGERDNYESFSSRNDNIISSLASPIATGSWNYKSMSSAPVKNSFPKTNERGRGRSRKRSQFYNSLSSYHSHFLRLITDEFLAEVRLMRDTQYTAFLRFDVTNKPYFLQKLLKAVEFYFITELFLHLFALIFLFISSTGTICPSKD